MKVGERRQPNITTGHGTAKSGPRPILPSIHTLMSDHIYKKIELVGSSKVSIEEAVNNAVARAAQTIRNMRWLEVVETRGHIADGKIEHWQVTVKIGFTLD